MKKTRRVGISLIAACLMIFLLAVSAQAATTKITVPVGGQVTAKVKGVSLKKAKWTTNKIKVATVDKKGLIKGKKAGKAKITAKVGKKKYVFSVTVKKGKISTQKATLTVGGSLKLSVKGLDKSVKVTWKSSKKSVVKVSKKGVIKAVKAGKATITATCCKKKYKCKVTVNNAARLNAGGLTISPGGTYTLSLQGVSGLPSWSSSNSSVARVDDYGKITAVKAGSAKITATLGGKSYTCAVTVKAPSTTSYIQKTTTTVVVVKPVNGESETETTSVSSSSSSSKSSSSSQNGSSDNNNGKVVYPSGSKENKAYKTLVGFKSKYPEGMRFTNDDFRAWVGGIYRGGYGCAGFCFELSDACFAPNLAQMRTTNLTKGLRPGDIIRLDYNSHSVIVLEVYKDEVVVAEANYNSSVHWGRHITFDEIERTGTNVITRYEESSAAAVKGLMEIIDTLPVLQ